MFTSPTGEFTVLLPAQPTNTAKDYVKGVNASANYHQDLFSTDWNGTILDVQKLSSFEKTVASGFSSNPQAILTALVTVLVSKDTGNKLISSQATTYQSEKAIDFLIENNSTNADIKGRIILSGQTIYEMTAIYKKGGLSDADYAKFINSFQITSGEQQAQAVSSGNIGTEVDTTAPKNSTRCNGTNYSACSSGSDFVCPGDGGQAYCQPRTPQTQKSSVQSQTQSQTQDLSAAVLVKNDAVGTINKIISSYSYLDSLQTADINSMNGVLSALANNNSQTAVALRNLTNLRITRIMNQQSPTQSIIAKAQSDLVNLQSQPLSYFLTYQTPTDTYSALNAFQGFASSFVSDYNTYSAILAQAATPIAVPRSTSCTVQSAGGGIATINCY